MIDRYSIRLLALLCSTCVSIGPAIAESTSDFDYVQEKLRTVSWGQYMAQDCNPDSMGGWNEFPTVLCRYPTQYGAVPVVLLDPNNSQLAHWLVTACNDASLTQVHDCAERIAVQIKCQSGNQFPIAGFVDEGPLYLFRDGITVSIKGFSLGDCAGLRQKPSPYEEDLALTDGSVTKVCNYARLTGTSRAEFAAFAHVPLSTVSGSLWQDQIREEYQIAWSSPRNRLISAWAIANSASLDPQLPFDKFFQSACPEGTRWSRWN